MCQQCLDLAIKYYPYLNEKDRCRLLMSSTAFPFAQPEVIEKQLLELKENTDGSLDAAISYAEDKLMKAMKEIPPE